MGVEVRTVPQRGAAKKVDTFFDSEQPASAADAPSSEQARYEPRFRVVTRKPLAAPRKLSGLSALQRAMLIGAVPALCLVAYVLFWTLAARGSYVKAQLQAQMKAVRTEQAELDAEKRRLQSPGMILDRAARELAMQPARQRQFAKVGSPAASAPVDAGAAEPSKRKMP
jgi:hypothetical protein